MYDLGSGPRCLSFTPLYSYGIRSPLLCVLLRSPCHPTYDTRSCTVPSETSSPYTHLRAFGILNRSSSHFLLRTSTNIPSPLLSSTDLVLTPVEPFSEMTV